MRADNRPSVASKISPDHLDGLAYVYVRQSTPRQVDRNRESQAYQYQMTQRAIGLGWPPERVRVIDTDLGRSGAESQDRDGFKELVAEVSLGHVGLIVGYEVSRLARNNADWYHLLDLASVFGTLIADCDGLYDPRLYNDRLLLGLKGTMSEAELHLLRVRLDAGRLAQVARGQYRQVLPTGLLRLSDGTVVKDPDQQVVGALDLVLTKFGQLGSCGKVMRTLGEMGVLVPRRQHVGRHKGEIVWKPASVPIIAEIVKNPAYAGAFVYGRSRKAARVPGTGMPRAGRKSCEMADWIHIEQGVYPAYIGWEDYMANQERLKHNARHIDAARRGATRQGEALLQGLVRCGVCGTKMSVSYGPPHRYMCCAMMKHYEGKRCGSFAGRGVDEVVRDAFFAAISESELDALETVMAEQAAEREAVERQWRQRRERAGYEAELARRQYDAVDPANRLVAGELERRWEAKLEGVREVEEAYRRYEQAPVERQLSRQVREQLRDISRGLPEIWACGKVTNVHKKEMVRCLVAEVILTRQGTDAVEVRIVWVSGHYSTIAMRPRILRDRDVEGYDRMEARIGEMISDGATSDAVIAQRLTGEGYRSARSEGVSVKSVRKIRARREWYLPLEQSRRASQAPEWVTPTVLARRLGVATSWVYKRIYAGDITGEDLEQRGKAWFLKDDPELIERLEDLLERRLAKCGRHRATRSPKTSTHTTT